MAYYNQPPPPPVQQRDHFLKKSSRRLYPQHFGNSTGLLQPSQQSNIGHGNNAATFHQQSFRQSDSLAANYIHQDFDQNFQKLSITDQSTRQLRQSLAHKKLDVSLLGNAPLVNDLVMPSLIPSLPASASVTSPVHSQCDSIFQHCTLNDIPYSNYLLKKSKLPLSIILEPYPKKAILEKNNIQVPVISHGSAITRCMKCKSFINPFIHFVEGGLKWQCNICSFNDNDVPPSFDWDPISQKQLDRWSRPELNHGCVDYIASSEFMNRPPQPPVYLFLIDVTFEAIQTGMINVLSESLLASLDQFPNVDGRTRIGFMTVNDSIGFYSLAGKKPEYLLLSDLDDIYLPRMHSDLVVNLTEAKLVIIDLLEKLKNGMLNVKNTAYNENKNCLGSALKAARLVLAPTGGKIVCFQACLPSIGAGALSPSVLQKQYQALASESLLLEPTSDFYRSFSEECIKNHICTDMFIFGSQNVDVATLNVIPRFTGGQTYYYPGFNSTNLGDRQKLEFEIKKLVQEEIGLEAIIRTRCSPGLICKSYHGNFSFQEPDILVLPNVPENASYCIDLAIERELISDLAYIQTCMLFTTCYGERVIRVMTTCLPITRKIHDIFSAADQAACVRAMNYQAIDKAITLKIRDAKEYLVYQTTAICTAYCKEVVGISPSKAPHLNLPRSLSLLPAMVLALLKSEAFNGSGAVPTNISTQSGLFLRTLPSSLWLRYVYPAFYSLHNMSLQSGTFDENNQCIMPKRLSLSSEKLERHGCYLLENGQRILLWIGREAVPQLCTDLLGASHIQEVASSQIASLPELDNPLSQRVSRIIKNLCTELRHSNFYPTLYVVREDGDPMLRNLFMTHLVEDRQQPLVQSPRHEKSINATTSYFQWLNYVKEKM